MDTFEYQALAQRTASTSDSPSKLLNAALGLCGESGEIADAVKKHLFQGHPLDEYQLIREAGDVCWYLAELAEALHVPISTFMEQNILKLKKRYPNGFDTDRSQHREEGDT